MACYPRSFQRDSTEEIIACAFYTTALSAGLLYGDATYAPAATIASSAVMVIGIASVVLLVVKQSCAYYARSA